jgi:hypothetical protein
VNCGGLPLNRGWKIKKYFHVGKKLYFCIRFWFPREGAKRESGVNPEQSRCCEFQRATQLFTNGHCGASRCCGKAKSPVWNKSEDLPKLQSIINSPEG